MTVELALNEFCIIIMMHFSLCGIFLVCKVCSLRWSKHTRFAHSRLTSFSNLDSFFKESYSVHTKCRNYAYYTACATSPPAPPLPASYARNIARISQPIACNPPPTNTQSDSLLWTQPMNTDTSQDQLLHTSTFIKIVFNSRNYQSPWSTWAVLMDKKVEEYIYSQPTSSRPPKPVLGQWRPNRMRYLIDR